MKSTDPVLALIGNTPVVRLQNIDTGPCELYVKLESQNPGGSIKDRIALAMIEAAERSGQLRAGGTIIEATAGNTGLGLALVVPDKMSTEKIQQLKAMGAEVILTRSDVNKGHPCRDLSRPALPSAICAGAKTVTARSERRDFYPSRYR